MRSSAGCSATRSTRRAAAADEPGSRCRRYRHDRRQSGASGRRGCPRGQGRAVPPTRRRRSPMCGRTEGRHGGTDHLPRGRRRRHRPRDAPRPDTWSASARTSVRPRACSRRRRACSRSSARSGCGTRRSPSRPSSAPRMGAAMTGMRPVAEIMFSDFFACCWDYLANEIPKVRYMTGGQVTVPLVIRTANGGGLGFGAQHSQAVENWVVHRARSQDRRTVHTGRRGGPDGLGDPQRRPGGLLRAQGPVRQQGRARATRSRRAIGRGRGRPSRRPTSRSSRSPPRCRLRWRRPSSSPPRASRSR